MQRWVNFYAPMGRSYEFSNPSVGQRPRADA